MRLVTSCVRLACDVELLSNNRRLFLNVSQITLGEESATNEN
jgi:hypothetical protein